MSEFRPHNAPLPGQAAGCNGIRDRMLVGLVLIGLVRAGEVLAGGQTSAAGAPSKLNIGDIGNGSSSPVTAMAMATSPAIAVGPAITPTPGLFATPPAMKDPEFSTTDFRPRKHSVFSNDPIASPLGDPPALRATTVWQRLSDYKSHDRVQLLTLWESSGSTVSLQAGTRGSPSLQWTSRLMNHGGSTRGVFDRLLSVSLAGAGNGLRTAPRPSGATATPKPISVPATAGQR
jgi:hypothetical protein